MAEPSVTPVTALVVSYNSAAVIEHCLRSIGGSVPTLVVDNASVDDTLARADACPNVSVLRNAENVGFGAAANIGLSAIDSPLVLLLNPDVRIGTPAIAILERAAAQHPRAAVLGPTLRYPADAKPPMDFALPLFSKGHPLFKPWFRSRHRAAAALPAADGAAHTVGWLPGCALLLRHAAIDELGGFDERIFLYYEETDLCLRALCADWQVLRVPQATAHHQLGSSSLGLDTLALSVLCKWHLEWSRFYMARKWRRNAFLGLRLAWQFLVLCAKLSQFGWLRVGRRARWRRRVAAVSGAWSACIGQPSARRLDMA